MIFNVAICDDNITDIHIMKEHLRTYEMKYDVDFDITIFSDSNSLLSICTKPGVFHILFLDVEMPNMNGLELARRIRALPDRQTKIVFISNYPEYMQDSFNVQAFNYLQKPLNYDSFEQIVHNIMNDYSESHITKFLISCNGIEELVYVDNIVSIEVLNSKKKLLRISLTNKTIETKGLINDLENTLKPLHFASPYRGILININHIHFFKSNYIIMSNGLQFPLSRRNEKNLRNMFNRRILTISKNR